MSGGADILIEWSVHGGAMHVRAVDSLDGLEVSFIAPSAVSEQEIRSLSVAKLRFVRARRSVSEDSGDKGPGLVV